MPEGAQKNLSWRAFECWGGFLVGRQGWQPMVRGSGWGVGATACNPGPRSWGQDCHWSKEWLVLPLNLKILKSVFILHYEERLPLRNCPFYRWISSGFIRNIICNQLTARSSERTHWHARCMAVTPNPQLPNNLMHLGAWLGYNSGY